MPSYYQRSDIENINYESYILNHHGIGGGSMKITLHRGLEGQLMIVYNFVQVIS
jgi:hypothetical protein